MELKVQVDGYERHISGVSEHTTCAQIINALAQAIGECGRFVLVERYKNNERWLASNDKPIESLKTWRDHASKVYFEMKRVEGNEDIGRMTMRVSRQDVGASLPLSANPTSCYTCCSSTSKEVRKPPPPDYKTVMEQCKSITSRRSQVSDGSEFYEPATQLMNEELKQLLVQKKNLSAVLQPLVACNWPQKYHLEIKRSHRLKASIEAAKEALDKTKSYLLNLYKQEEDLIRQIEELNKDPLFDEVNLKREI